MKSALRLRYLILLLLCAMYFIAYVDRVNVAVAGPLIRKTFGLSPTELGLVFSAFAYPYACMQVFGGWLSDRFGPRRVLAALSVLWALGTILTGLSFGLYGLIGVRVVVGLGEGGAFPAATRALAHWLPIRERGLAQGVTHSSARLGGAVTPPMVLAVAAAYGWRGSFIVLGVASLGWTFAWLLIFKDRPEEHAWMKRTELAEIGGPVVNFARRADDKPVAGRSSSECERADDKPPVDGRGRRTPWRRIVREMWLVTLVDFCYGWTLWVFLTWLPSYLAEARGFDLKRMALMTMLPLLAGVVGDTLGGVVSDGLYRRTGDLGFARRSVLVVGLLGALVFMIPAVVIESPTAAVCDLALAFFFLELTNAVLWTLPLDIAGEFAGTAGGVMNTGFGVAGMISPVVFGFVIQRTGSYRPPFFISAALLLLGAVVSTAIDPTRTISSAGRVRPRAVAATVD